MHDDDDDDDDKDDKDDGDATDGGGEDDDDEDPPRRDAPPSSRSPPSRSPRRGGDAASLPSQHHCPREWELHLLLSEALMVRRRKRDVVAQLPPKTRVGVLLPLAMPPGAPQPDAPVAPQSDAPSTGALRGGCGATAEDGLPRRPPEGVGVADAIGTVGTLYEATGLAKVAPAVSGPPAAARVAMPKRAVSRARTGEPEGGGPSTL